MFGYNSQAKHTKTIAYDGVRNGVRYEVESGFWRKRDELKAAANGIDHYFIDSNACISEFAMIPNRQGEPSNEPDLDARFLYRVIRYGKETGALRYNDRTTINEKDIIPEFNEIAENMNQRQTRFHYRKKRLNSRWCKRQRGVKELIGELNKRYPYVAPENGADGNVADGNIEDGNIADGDDGDDNENHNDDDVHDDNNNDDDDNNNGIGGGDGNVGGTEVQELENRRNENDAELTIQRQQLSHCREKIANMLEYIDKLEDERERKDGEIRRKDGEIRRKDGEIQRKDGEIQRKDGEIRALKRKLQQLTRNHGGDDDDDEDGSGTTEQTTIARAKYDELMGQVDGFKKELERWRRGEFKDLEAKVQDDPVRVHP